MLPIKKDCLASQNELGKKENFLPSKESNSVKIEKDERYTYIKIKKSYDSKILGKKNNTFVQTSITKDNILKTKITEIKKIFVTESSKKGIQNVIVRNIVVDKLRDKKLKFEDQISFEVDKNTPLLDVLADYLKIKVETPVLIN